MHLILLADLYSCPNLDYLLVSSKKIEIATVLGDAYRELTGHDMQLKFYNWQVTTGSQYDCF